MADWTQSMQRTYEYYIVDPNTWKDTKLLTTVKSASINRDLDTDTLGSATFDITESVGECYIRIYLVTIQNGVKERHPLGTFLVQTPSSSFDGKIRNVSMDAYTPLMELKEKQPPIGYFVPKTVFYKVKYENDEYVKTDEIVKDVIGEVLSGVKTTTGEQVFFQNNGNIYYCSPDTVMNLAYRLIRENARAPVVNMDGLTQLRYDKTTATGDTIYAENFTPLTYDFVSDVSDTWFAFLYDLIATANYEFDLDELGRILFKPKQNFASLQPVWTYNDDNSSILYPDLTMDHDLYGIPNVVEVVYSTGSDTLSSRAVNDDPNSPTSTVSRGREIIYRVVDPDLVGIPTQNQINELAEQTLSNLSSIEYTITYSHGYCPVRIGDCVRLNYTRAGINNIKARVISQSISCDASCKVTEKAVFTTKLWR